MLEPARRGRLTWLADLVLLSRREPEMDWQRVDRLAIAWGLTSEIAGLRGYLAAQGAAPGAPDNADRVPGEATLQVIRRLARRLPAMARASGALQLRPILVARLWRFAFPGQAWIGWRYGLGNGAGGWPVWWRSVRHASGVALGAAWMAVAVLFAWLRGRLTSEEASSPLTESDRKAPGPSQECPP
jgi:hypothetical protein